MRSSRLRSAILATAAFAAPLPAFAHAHLVSASPSPNAQLARPPVMIRATFSEPLEPAFSSLTVQGPPGFRGMRNTTTGADRRTLSANPRAQFPPGRYRVSWRVMSVDSHTTQGTFSFQVGR